MTRVAPIVICADAPRWGGERCIEVVERVVSVVPRGFLAVWDREPADARAGSDRARLERLRRLRALTRTHGHELVVGARVDLALAADADGVHLPEHGLEAALVRRDFPSLTVSRSCHDRAGLEAALKAGASWATLSPFAPPLSKSSDRPALGAAGFSEAIRGLSLPVLALGGVTPERMASCWSAGARGVAISGSVFETASPEAVVAAIAESIPKALKGPD